MADADARRACEHLIAYDPRYAGQAFYLATGEVARLRGRHDEAMEAYDRARWVIRASPTTRCCWPPAVVARRPWWPFGRRCRICLRRCRGPQALVAMVELGVACASPDDATRAHRELVALAAHSRSEVLDRLLDGTAGLASIGLAGSGEAEHDPAQDLARLRKAAAALRSVGVPYEAARFHRAASRVAGDLGDPETAELGPGRSPVVRRAGSDRRPADRSRCPGHRAIGERAQRPGARGVGARGGRGHQSGR